MRLLLLGIYKRGEAVVGARECRRGPAAELLRLSSCRARGWWEKFSSLPFGSAVYITYFFNLAAVFKKFSSVPSPPTIIIFFFRFCRSWRAVVQIFTPSRRSNAAVLHSISNQSVNNVLASQKHQQHHHHH